MGEYLIISDFIMLGIMSFMTITLFVSFIIAMLIDTLRDKKIKGMIINDD